MTDDAIHMAELGLADKGGRASEWVGNRMDDRPFTLGRCTSTKLGCGWNVRIEVAVGGTPNTVLMLASGTRFKAVISILCFARLVFVSRLANVGL